MSKYSTTAIRNAQFIFFNKWNPVCSFPECDAQATVILFALVPTYDSQRGVSSCCQHHAEGYVREVGAQGFVPLGSGGFINPAVQARMMLEAAAELAVDSKLRAAIRDTIARFDKGTVDAKTIDCESHGETPWRGEVVCCDCDRMYRLPYDGQDPSLELFEPKNPPYCDCGALLSPGPDVLEPERDNFTGRSVCPRCFEDHQRYKRGH